jgi:hypothetical protein
VRGDGPRPPLFQIFLRELVLQPVQYIVCELVSLGHHAHRSADVPGSGSSKGFGFDWSLLYASSIFLQAGTDRGQASDIVVTASRWVSAHSQARLSRFFSCVPGWVLVGHIQPGHQTLTETDVLPPIPPGPMVVQNQAAGTRRVLPRPGGKRCRMRPDCLNTLSVCHPHAIHVGKVERCLDTMPHDR